MAKKGRINRNSRVLKAVESQREKRDELRERRRKIVSDYTAKLEKAKGEDEAQAILSEATAALFELSVIFQKIKRDGAAVRYRNRCSITGRPRGYRRMFGLSRNVIREASAFGLIMGLTKSSW